MPDLYELVQNTIREATEEIARGSEPLAVVVALRAAAHAVEYGVLSTRGGRRQTDVPAGDVTWPGGARATDPPTRYRRVEPVPAFGVEGFGGPR